MMPAAKMMDPVMGIDIHIIQPPGPVPPLPIPHPFVGMLFDPMELAPLIGASVFVNGMPKATAGSEGKALPPHIPIGGMFVPPPPGNECEMFMGSATVLFEGEPASYLALPALSCQSVGMPSPPRAKKKPKPILKLPTSVVMPIPAGPPVLIGGPPTISMTVIGMKVAMGALGKAAKKFRKFQQGSKKWAAISAKVKAKAAKAMDALGVPSSSSIRNKVDNAICTLTGHPVDVATGKVLTDNLDFGLPGPIPLRWKRIYFSTSVYQGPLGYGWHHSYDLALAENGKAVAVRFHDGRPLAFPRLKLGASFFLRSEKATLSRDEEGYTLRTRDNLVHRFAPRPTAKGEQPLISVSNSSGSQMTFTYDAHGHLEAIKDSAGRLIKFNTDWQGRILQIQVPHPEIAERFIPVMTYRYDENGNLVEASDALNQPWRFAYSHHLLTRETNRNGLSFQFEYDGRDASAKCLRTWGDGGIYDHKLAYDEAKKITTVENSLGRKTVYHVADSGLVTRVVNANGKASETSYNDFNELEKEIDELGQETSYEYDDRGNCIKVKGPDGAALEIGYLEDSPVSAKDALGGEWKWEYDDKRRPLKRIDPLGRVTEYRYDGPRLAAILDPAGRETRLEYGASEEVAALVLPDGAASRWEYDRLGRCVAALDPMGNARRRVFDALGRPRKIEEPDGNVRELEYDPDGNIVRARDKHHDVGFQYQGMNRMSSRSEHGTVVEFKYDTEERLVGIKNEHGSVYGFELDPTGEVTVESGFDGIRRKYLRDAKGRVTEVERAGGILTQYQHDAADRVIQIIHSNGEQEAYQYRADGELLEAANATGKIAFRRDALGRVVQEDQDGHAVESAYDLLGMRILMKSSLGAHQRIERNAMGDVTRVSFGPDEKASQWEARFTRDALGLELERALPGGIRSKWTRDKVGRPLRHNIVSAKEFRSREYAWDVNDRLDSIRDSRHGLTAFEHDPLGNLIWSEGPDGSHLFRMPDAVGNLFRSPDRDDRKYGPAGQLLEARGPKGITRYEYDAEGNLVRKTEPGDKVWTYHWNAAGMLAKVVRPDGLEVEFAYDALGRRTSKKFRGRTTRWVWDGNNPLHEWVEGELREAATGGSADWSAAAEAGSARREAEMAGKPAAGPPREELGTAKEPVTWLFEPESFSPMAKLVGGKRYSIVTDHLGTPLAMFDAEGRETWSARIDIYGRLADLKGERGDCPFRFPGQYEDRETGLRYNRFRYYDEEGGEYLSQDPIRLKGGLRLYSYPLDPLVHSDKCGLAPWVFDPAKDVDMTGGKGTYQDALDEAFDRTGLPKEEFTVTNWQKNIYGKTAPAEWTHPSGAIVNVDDPTIIPTGEGPQKPHVGYQTGGKRRGGGAVRGHILVDSVPVTRPGLGCKKAGK